LRIDTNNYSSMKRILTACIAERALTPKDQDNRDTRVLKRVQKLNLEWPAPTEDTTSSRFSVGVASDCCTVSYSPARRMIDRIGAGCPGLTGKLSLYYIGCWREVFIRQGGWCSDSHVGSSSGVSSRHQISQRGRRRSPSAARSCKRPVASTCPRHHLTS
jgi:hypothetical protein